MADPGYPRWEGADSWIWGKSLLLGKISAENCMKMKKNWTKEGMPLVSPLDLPMLMLLFYFNFNINVLAVADPGFPRGGGANPRGGGGPPTYDFAKFFQKLHRIERI